MDKEKIKHFLGVILQVLISIAILLIYITFFSSGGSEDGLGLSFGFGGILLIAVPIYAFYSFIKKLLERKRDKNKKDDSGELNNKDSEIYFPEGVDINDPEVREFWQGIKNTRDRGHYSFVHNLLRDLALDHPQLFSNIIIHAHKVPKENPFKELWLKNGGSEDDLEKDTFKPRFKSLPGDDILIVMKMPKVELPNESEYIGINLKTKGNLNFYTFELTRNGKYVLCKWMKEEGNRKPTHYLLSKEYDNSSIETFYDGILKLAI